MQQNQNLTLNMLKDVQHALNRRLLLAMQTHDEESLLRLQDELRDVQSRIDRMKSGIRKF